MLLGAYGLLAFTATPAACAAAGEDLILASISDIAEPPGLESAESADAVAAEALPGLEKVVAAAAEGLA